MKTKANQSQHVELGSYSLINQPIQELLNTKVLFMTAVALLLDVGRKETWLNTEVMILILYLAEQAKSMALMALLVSLSLEYFQ